MWSGALSTGRFKWKVSVRFTNKNLVFHRAAACIRTGLTDPKWMFVPNLKMVRVLLRCVCVALAVAVAET